MAIWYTNRMAKKVRILPPISARFVRSGSVSFDSAKTYENPVRGTACRNTDEFPVPVTAALIGPFLACPRKGMRLWESCRRDGQIRLHGGDRIGRTSASH